MTAGIRRPMRSVIAIVMPFVLKNEQALFQGNDICSISKRFDSFSWVTLEETF
jgi:hypothetical protein